MSVNLYLLLFRFYVIHDDQMLINILKKSILELHKDATMILLHQFLGGLKTTWRAIYEVDGGLKPAWFISIVCYFAK